MPYYRGDYYRGDYYRGDVWSTLKKGGKAIVDPKGYAEGQLFGSGPKPKAPPAPPSSGGMMQGIHEFLTGHPAAGGQIRGYHPNKANEYDPSQHGRIVVPKGSKMVRNRHMNVANPRALARAARRAHGFLKLSSKFVRYYQPHAKKGHAFIGRKRKSR